MSEAMRWSSSPLVALLFLCCGPAAMQEPPFTARQPPSPPTALVAELQGDAPLADVRLSWRAAADPAVVQFVIERRSKETGFTTLTGAPTPDRRQWTDVSPPAGFTYTYRVRAVSGAGPSEPSPEARAIKTAAAGMIGRPDDVGFRLVNVFSGDLQGPTSLAVHPRDGSVWIVNGLDDSSVVIDGFDRPEQRYARFHDDSAHFMHHPTQLSFSNVETFGTCQETNTDDGGMAAPGLFMGPVIWTANRAQYEGGRLSHLDGLHHSSWCMGITSIKDDEYWVFNGEKGALDQSFFGKPHAPGGDGHGDGRTYRHAAGELRRVAGVPSHLVFNPEDQYLYVADTGNARVAKIRTGGSLAAARAIPGDDLEAPLYEIPDSHTTTLAGGPGSGLAQPSGLFLYRASYLFVADSARSTVSVFDLAGTLMGSVDLSEKIAKGSLTGILVRDERIYVLDGKGNRVVRIDFQL